MRYHQKQPACAVRPTPNISRLLSTTYRRTVFWIEAATAVIVTLLIVALHVGLCRTAGGLWRDEANAVQLATLPTLGEVWHFMDYDSIPLLFLGMVRAFAAIFPLDDSHLRALGLGIGLLIVGAIWLDARRLRAGWPLFSLVLLGLNPMLIRYGDSLRAYGLGVCLMLVALGAVWKVIESPHLRRVILASAAAVASVQCLYYNAVLLLAICAGGVAVAARERRWAVAATVVGIGAVAAVSLLPYLPIFRRVHDWNFLLKSHVTVAWLWKKISDVTGAPDPLGIWLWAGLFLLGLGLAGYRLLSGGKAVNAPSENGNRVLLFATTALVVGTLAYGGFLKALGYFTQPWYYLAFLALAAICLDTIFFHVSAGLRWRLVRLVAAVGFAVTTFLQTREDLRLRHTNLDLVAATLNASVVSGDLVVLDRWECAISFQRYFHGPAPMATLPPLEDHRFHRYDLIKRQMMASAPIAPVLDAMGRALQAGHRVWLVGTPQFLRPGATLPHLPPAFVDAAGRWHGGPYYDVWAIQACQFLQTHAINVRPVPVPVGQRVSDFEDLPLSVFDGWRTPGAVPPQTQTSP